jgi:hypothetical protein
MAFGLDDLALGASVVGGLGSTGLLGKQFQKVSPYIGLGGLAYGAYNSNAFGSSMGNNGSMENITDPVSGDVVNKVGYGAGGANGNWVDKAVGYSKGLGNFGGVSSPATTTDASGVAKASPYAGLEAGAKILGGAGQMYGAYNQGQLANKQIKLAQSNYADDKNYYRNRQSVFDNAFNTGFQNSRIGA